MATHSSVLAWRTPGTGEPRGLPCMGSHRVGHDWSDLAAVAAASSWKCHFFCPYYFCCRVAVYLLSRIWRFETPWTAAHQAPVLHCRLELAQALVHWVGDAVRWFARYRIWVWHRFSFSILQGSFPCFLASVIFEGEVRLILIIVLLHAMNLFSCQILKLPHLEFQHFDYDLLMYGFLCSDPTWNSRCFLNVWFDIFHQFWKNFNCYVFKYLFYRILSFASCLDSSYVCRTVWRCPDV